MPVANVLDPIHPTLSPYLWDHPEAPEPVLKPRHAHWIKRAIYRALDGSGYGRAQDWLSLVLTGSLTTYQYGDESDCDVSLFVNSTALPEWSRAEMIGIMIQDVDGHMLPGTPYPMQDFVVSRSLKPADLYRPGLRSGYDLDAGRWIVPPEKDRSRNIEAEENGFYTYALQMADKMERLLRYEPDKAVQFWHQIHARRSRDQQLGKGDSSESNIIYKFLEQRKLMPEIAQASGEHIAASAWPQANQWRVNIGTYPAEHIRDWMIHHYPQSPMQAVQGLGGWGGEPELSTGLHLYDTPAEGAQEIVDRFGYAHPHEEAFGVQPLGSESFLYPNPHHRPIPEQGSWEFGEGQLPLGEAGAVAWQPRALARRHVRPEVLEPGSWAVA